MRCPRVTATLQNPSSASIASPCLTQQVPSTPAIVPVATAQVSSSTDQFKTFSTATHIPIHSNAPALQSNDSNLSSSSSPVPPMPPMPSNEMPPSQAVVGKNSTITSAVVSTPPATDTALYEQVQQVQPCKVKYLSQTAHQSFTNR